MIWYAVCSIVSKNVQNSEKYISQSDDRVKQDCESKAFGYLAEKIKKAFHGFRFVIALVLTFVTCANMLASETVN